MSLSGSILLVGEGNFSFSASLSQSRSEAAGGGITATCLQGQDEALRHEGAAERGTVLFEVDCTKLGECAALQGRAFDRVVFNFPHCGRKSGVKKNRELLKSFFLSCVQVLAEGGEVHVSLCNGQGGTPADHPTREWHNSWQVAAMAAEAHLILTDVHPFQREKHQSYKCTGYRSQDKGFHVEKALLHVFTRSLPNEPPTHKKITRPQAYCLFSFIRGFLCSGSVHPVRLAQDFLLKRLAEKWSVSMTMETFPLLLTAKQLQMCCHEVDATHYYWIELLQKEPSSNVHTSAGNTKDQSASLASRECTDTRSAPSATCLGSKGGENLKPACCPNVDPEREGGIYVLRPSLLPQAEDLLFGMSGLVFRNVSINPWALPSFHELVLRGVFPSACNPVTLHGQMLETLLAPYGVSLVSEQGGLCLTAQPMGLVGRVFASNAGDDVPHVSITVCLNLDLLAVLLFSLPDWRLLWSHDPRFLKQFTLRPSPGKAFRPLSLFPEHISFDISFWTGLTWEERKFHVVVREASCGTVEQVKLVDRFSHPDLSQTSYCYRLTYRSHTHALSHTQALQFHKQLESLLSSRLQVTIR
uniref:FDX-ACB domain-containing protein n=1 Tax=Mola mola TaxID=94237 RepID=A0A3Q3X1C6_MOLML